MRALVCHSTPIAIALIVGELLRNSTSRGATRPHKFADTLIKSQPLSVPPGRTRFWFAANFNRTGRIFFRSPVKRVGR